MQRKRQMNVAAFTLVELLVVIGIISLLMGILMPSLSKVSQQARQIRCQSNLRQWAAAVITYANDNQACLPRRGQGIQATSNVTRPEDWFNALPPLMNMPTYATMAAAKTVPSAADNSLWSCPEADKTPTGNFFAYAMNMGLSPWNVATPDKLTRVGPTSTMVFLTEGPGQFCSVFPSAQGYSPVARHGGRINIAFLDGHISAFPGQEVGCGIGDPQRDDVRWSVPNSAWSGA